MKTLSFSVLPFGSEREEVEMAVESLSIPVSVSFYMSSRANRNALDLIIRKPELPPDLRWDEVLAFHDATMAAQRVQLDYFALLHKTWEATWGVAKKQLLPSVEQPTVSELAELAPTVETAWNTGCILSKIDLPQNCIMWSAVDWSDLTELKLYFYVDIGDEDYSLSDNLALSADWQPVDTENCRATVPGLCPIKAEKADLTRLANAAYGALDLVLKNIKEPAL